MRRREFIKGIAGSAVAWPLAVHAQSPSKVLRVGTVFAAPRSRSQWQALEHRLTDLGYRDGANYIMDYVKISRVAEADYKAEYLKLMERDADIIVAGGPKSP